MKILYRNPQFQHDTKYSLLPGTEEKTRLISERRKQNYVKPAAGSEANVALTGMIRKSDDADENKKGKGAHRVFFASK